MNCKTYLGAACVLASAIGWSAGANAATNEEAVCVSPKAVAGYKLNSPKPVNGSVDVTWRVTYTRFSTAANSDIDVTGFYTRTGTGAWTSIPDTTWQLNYGLRGQTPSPLRGNLAALQLRDIGTPLKADQGIRLVAPDGGCAVQLAYPDGGAVSLFKTIDILGDQVLQDQTINYLKYAASLRNLVVHADARDNARWANYDDKANLSLLDQSDNTQLDELRGTARNLFQNNAIVIALGANDSLYVGSSSARSAETQQKILNVLKEVQTTPTCVVLVSPPSSKPGNATYNANADALETLYSYAALGGIAGVDPAKIRVVGFGGASKSHAYGSASPWFLSDGIKLNPTGELNYASLIIQGVDSCGS